MPEGVVPYPMFGFSSEVLTFYKAGTNGFFLFPAKARNHPALLSLGHVKPDLTLKGFFPLSDIRGITFGFQVEPVKGNMGLQGQILEVEPLHRGPQSFSRLLLELGFSSSEASVLVKAIPASPSNSLLDVSSSQLKSLCPSLSDFLCRKWDAMVDYFKTHNLVKKYGFSPAHYDRIQAVLGPTTHGSVSSAVSSNPFLLLSSPVFTIQDAKKLAAGREFLSSFLYQGYILQTLRSSLDEGHTNVGEGVLLRLAREQAKVYEEDDTSLIDALNSLCQLGVVTKVFPSSMRLDGPVEPRIYLTSYANSERLIADTLKAKLETQAQVLLPPPEGEGFQWGDEQKQAIDLFLNQRVLALSGLPGTGKTTVVKAIVAAAKQAGLYLKLLAPTGMAARRLNAVTGVEASTIHYALAYDGQNFNVTSLECDVLVVDEMSMVDTELFARLLSSLPANCRLVLVGDDAQLPSVGPGSVFRDILNSKVIPSVRMTRVFRQAEGNQIVRASHEIHRGEVPGEYATELTSTFRLIPCVDPDMAMGLIVKLALKLTGEKRPFQVLSPIYKGPLGIDEINRVLRSELNPDSTPYRETFDQYGQGDRVVFTKNNAKQGYYNGDFGTVTRVSKEGLVVELEVQSRSITVPFLDLNLVLRLGYCISVHRSQGNEYGVVILPLFSSHGRMLERTLLYTAVTRAKEKAVLLTDRGALAKAVSNQNVSKRHTGLRSFLTGDFSLSV